MLANGIPDMNDNPIIKLLEFAHQIGAAALAGDRQSHALTERSSEVDELRLMPLGQLEGSTVLSLEKRRLAGTDFPRHRAFSKGSGTDWDPHGAR
jgi:hypothetical protein